MESNTDSKADNSDISDPGSPVAIQAPKYSMKKVVNSIVNEKGNKKIKNE